jgi:hypothetical protein
MPASVVLGPAALARAATRPRPPTTTRSQATSSLGGDTLKPLPSGGFHVSATEPLTDGVSSTLRTMNRFLFLRLYLNAVHALAITDEASPFALRSTRNHRRRAMHRGAAWTAECHRGAAWLRLWPESRWQCSPPSSPGCRSPQVAPASPNPRTAVRDRAGSLRWSGMPGRLLRRPAPARAHCWCLLSGPAVPGPSVWVSSRPVSSRPVSGHPVSAIQLSSRPVSKPSGVQAVGCPSRRVSSHLVSAASALSASRSAVGSVRPGAGDAGGGLGRPAGQYWPRSGQVSLGCGCGRARPADRRGGQAVARISRRSRPSQCRKRAEHDVAAPAAWLCAHAVRGLNERDGWLPAGLGAATTVHGRHQCQTPGWNGQHARRGEGRAALGRPKQAASAAGWPCTSSSSGAVFTPRCRPAR